MNLFIPDISLKVPTICDWNSCGWDATAPSAPGFFSLYFPYFVLGDVPKTYLERLVLVVGQSAFSNQNAKLRAKQQAALSFSAAKT